MYFANHPTPETPVICSFQHSTKDNFGYKLMENFHFSKRSPVVNMHDKINELSVFEETVSILTQIWLFQKPRVTPQHNEEVTSSPSSPP
jgi:hypothetical protein